jgi:glucan 1,3-beta-glucosidase
VRGFIEAQLEVYEMHAQGWIYWNFKTETAGDWNAFGLLDAGVRFPFLDLVEEGRVCDERLTWWNRSSHSR